MGSVSTSSQMAPGRKTIGFDTDPSSYKHWRLTIEPPIGFLAMQVSPHQGLSDSYELKLNSYDLGVDIELHDAMLRLRLEHPEVKAVVITGGLEEAACFCAGANIQMLAGASPQEKINFCKFTNETRLAIEEASARSGQAWIAALNGVAAGGGYELALACDEILLVDDHSSAVSLPEVSLLAVLPGTGGLTRLVDKRRVRRDLADVFATKAEGVRGSQALEWGLVDFISPRSGFEQLVRERALARAEQSDRPADAKGIALPAASCKQGEDGTLEYPWITARPRRELFSVEIVLRGPDASQPTSPDQLDEGSWLVGAARQLEDAILRLRHNEPELGTWVIRTEGDPMAVLEAESVLRPEINHWLSRELRLWWGRILRRLDVSSRSVIALIEPGSCFSGMLAEFVLAADQAFMLDSQEDPDWLIISDANDGWFPMGNGLSRLETRFWGRPEALEVARATIGSKLSPLEALQAGLVTFVYDDLDWDDEVRLRLEERASFSPDALTAMEANLRFVGPETMETKIFGRLSAWQNWVFSRPNATGPQGALHCYGTGTRPFFNRTRT